MARLSDFAGLVHDVLAYAVCHEEPIERSIDLVDSELGSVSFYLKTEKWLSGQAF